MGEAFGTKLYNSNISKSTWVRIKNTEVADLIQYVEIISDEIVEAIIETFTGLNFMLQGFRICFI